MILDFKLHSAIQQQITVSLATRPLSRSEIQDSESQLFLSLTLKWNPARLDLLLHLVLWVEKELGMRPESSNAVLWYGLWSGRTEELGFGYTEQHNTLHFRLDLRKFRLFQINNVLNSVCIKTIFFSKFNHCLIMLPQQTVKKHKHFRFFPLFP